MKLVSPAIQASGFRWWYAPLAMAAGLGAQFVVLGLGLGTSAELVRQALFVVIASLMPLIASRPLRRGQLALERGLNVRVIGAAICGVAVIYGISTLALLTTPAVENSSEQVLQSMGFGQDIWADCVLVLVICVGAPLAEEALLRGIVLRSLLDGVTRIGAQRGWGREFEWLAIGIAVAGSAWLFADLHGGAGQDGVIHILFLHGIIYALLYLMTGSLLVTILAHALNNSLAMIEELVSSGLYSVTDLPFQLTLAGPVIAISLALIWRAVIPRG